MCREKFEPYLREIHRRICTPYCMANEKMADEMFSYVQEDFPEAVMVKQGLTQYIATTEQARSNLIERLQVSKLNHEKEIAEIDKAVNELMHC